MKIQYTILLFVLFSHVLPLQMNAERLRHNTPIATTMQSPSKQKGIHQTETDDKNAKALRNAVRVLGVLFIGFMILVLIVPFQTKGIVFLLALVSFILAFILALAGISNAKDKEAKKRARKSLWFVLGILLGLILAGIIALLNVRIA